MCGQASALNYKQDTALVGVAVLGLVPSHACACAFVFVTCSCITATSSAKDRVKKLLTSKDKKVYKDRRDKIAAGNRFNCISMP